jgi:hypothetical protein
MDWSYLTLYGNDCKKLLLFILFYSVCRRSIPLFLFLQSLCRLGSLEPRMKVVCWMILAHLCLSCLITNIQANMVIKGAKKEKRQIKRVMMGSRQKRSADKMKLIEKKKSVPVS